MFDTQEEALTFVGLGETVKYCNICEAWTVWDIDGYPMCFCV